MNFASPPITRRRFMVQTSALLAASSSVRAELRTANPLGQVVGEAVVEGIGAKILAEGGNAVDALVATALAGAITQPHQTGIGGYAASGIFAMNGGKRIAALDANSVAPAGFTKDIFKPDAKGQVPDRRNYHGWLASGVPGVIAGLKLALDEFGTMPFADVLQPSIQLTREGFQLSAALAGRIAAAKASFSKDAGTLRLFFPNGAAPAAGALFKNPELAEVLTTLARANSIEPFYRGDIALRMAEGFAKNGGLVTKDDLAAYRARLVEPLRLTWGEHTFHTPHGLCGGVTVLQMLALMKALNWDSIADGRQRLLLRVEAMRLAWRDRLNLIGDPEFGAAPLGSLLSPDHIAACADKISSAVKAGRMIEPDFTTSTQGGTLNFSACDKQGNIAALTLTHGDGFGAHVTVDGLGLTLGHGMSRFDPRPEHPNAPGPGKRPLHNMTPFLVTRNAQPIVAIGGRGGRKIPNAMLEFLTQHIIRHRPFGESLASPRLHTEGGKLIQHQPKWPQASIEALTRAGYPLKEGSSATLSGVALEKEDWLAGMQ